MSEREHGVDGGVLSQGGFAPGHSVCAIVVTFHPGEEVLANIAAVRRQVQHMIVVDNQASADSRARLSTLTADPAIELIFNEDNLGIAAAFNQGVARALARGFDWVATFDQDSRAPDGFIAGLLDGYANYPDRSRVAIIAPLYRDRNLGRVSSSSGPIRENVRAEIPVSVAASSGNLVAMSALRAIGGFREDFFIDCVDFEFCLRCRQRGWEVLEVRRVELDHAQGHWTRRRLLWRRPAVNDYSAGRRYYQARNRVIMYRHFASFDPRWILRDAWGYGCDLIKMILFCADRPAKLGAVVTGWWHALSGRRGRWDPT